MILYTLSEVWGGGGGESSPTVELIWWGRGDLVFTSRASKVQTPHIVVVIKI